MIVTGGTVLPTVDIGDTITIRPSEGFDVQHRTQPEWLRKFIARVLGLQPGRYTIVLSVYRDTCDWTVQQIGKIEK